MKRAISRRIMNFKLFFRQYSVIERFEHFLKQYPENADLILLQKKTANAAICSITVRLPDCKCRASCWILLDRKNIELLKRGFVKIH